ncbi:MAG: glycogen synthase, Corynebacterium family [Acidobacteria bacterium]|nr:glycogen synthase, Corynebacterium family [Acidobacteriota bacterium]
MKLACVVHRFGADIAGGSEGHCRLIAEHLAARHDVTVLTTCAKDHITWRNHYPAGETRVEPVSPKPGEGGLRVLRFPVVRERDMRRFMDLSDLVAADRATAGEQEDWFRENGPDAPELLAHLRQHGAGYDRILFWAYRYATSYFGLPLAADRAVLVPTAEDDPLIHVAALEALFARPKAFLFLTPEEETLVAARAPAGRPSAIIGSGLDPAPAAVDVAPLAPLRLADPFVLYLGRIDPNKGCAALIRHFLRYAEGGSKVQLVMAGPASMAIPDHPQIRPLGFVDEPTREALLHRARALIMPSPYESLSMVLLEAWNHALPALVNARCKVLRGQVARADGGLYYGNAMEFIAGLDYLLNHADVAAQMGRQGRDYVDREYRWPIVIEKIETVLAAV